MAASLTRALAFLCLLLATAAGAALYPQNPLQVGESIYVSYEGVYRFDEMQEKPLWHSLAGAQTFAPVAYRDLILVGSTQGLYALRQADGSVAWHIEKRNTLFTPTLASAAFAGSVHGEMYAIDIEDGGIHWRRQFDGWIYSPAIVVSRQQLWAGGQAHAIHLLDSSNGSLLATIATSQESVFGAVDLGKTQIAFNLFDGSSVVVETGEQRHTTSLAGASQPIGIVADGAFIYRSHSDGSLAIFRRDGLELETQRRLVAQNLVMHPSQPGYLLLGDQDRRLLLLELASDRIQCEFETGGQWLLPIQTQVDEITYFQKSVQPNSIRLVQSPATCQ